MPSSDNPDGSEAKSWQTLLKANAENKDEWITGVRLALQERGLGTFVMPHFCKAIPLVEAAALDNEEGTVETAL